METPQVAEEKETLARVTGETGGDLVLRRVGAHYEIYSNGVFLMDTRDGTSEREMVRASLAALPRGRGRARVLIGGLGVGFSAREALDDPRVSLVEVVELEPQVIAWHDGELGEAAGYVHRDPRCRVHNADIVAWTEAAAGRPQRYDAICLDTDNGPDWTVTEANGRLYRAAGLDLLKGLLAPGGVLAFWSANPVESFEALLRERFTHVEAIEVTVAHSIPDTVYLAREA
ncbi:spermidine synthase [Nocardiopsis changdeensis]|uniref:Spermidine synthase n=1 Tax=Nocardiopsis changdeensis TaxID=2831969 RepID=A0ABX8BLF0_9ACTN|nr:MULTISPECIES: spermidine synthase [Nocardiopsis]QKW31767.1 spermidine synthase [Nocardiopsis flavescens]QUX23059.1 spermidine synthase [Nocardiopsis changdeensis]QYX39004.1 spermidine synthase [Nocardiopsis sp. MT53]